jgi:hypothetical protein
MDTTSTPAISDFVFADVDGTIRFPDSLGWQTATNMELFVAYASLYDNPLLLTYTPGANPLQVLSGERAYGAMANIPIPIS